MTAQARERDRNPEPYGPHGRAIPPGRDSPDEHGPHEELGRDRESEDRGKRPDRRPIPPRERQGEREERGEVRHLERVRGRPPRQNRRVAAEITHAEEGKRADDCRDGGGECHPYDEVGGEHGERSEDDGELGRIDVCGPTRENRVVEGRIRRIAVHDELGCSKVRESEVPTELVRPGDREQRDDRDRCRCDQHSRGQRERPAQRARLRGAASPEDHAGSSWAGGRARSEARRITATTAGRNVWKPSAYPGRGLVQRRIGRSQSAENRGLKIASGTIRSTR